ncbi:hypothetical protein [Armatimonas rosea]|uniref:Uncharacterized protein n=1 Tax=Armatimonas rosea TaxID=685828 RepID=A0A7W9W5C1_ARMRO|nr:hypothetical protein [Armatimonas rosea]MBB6048765.1 hypothetical protein [Armatimonas rosea]
MKKLGYVIRVTKQTQAKEGLNYTLEARRVSPEAVLVSMEIPREGKLKDMSHVTMDIRPNLPPTNGPVSYSPLVSAPLLVTVGKNGAWSVSFQLASELAERCSVDLLIPKGPRGYFYYAVELKEYITDVSSR